MSSKQGIKIKKMQFNRKGVQRKHKEKADFHHQMTIKNCS